jgi:hypothetical protein
MYSLYKNEYRILKPVKTTVRKGLSRMKKNRGDETNWCYNVYIMEIYIYIYIYIHIEREREREREREMLQGNSLCSYLYLKQAKNVVFFLISFFLLQNGKRRGQNRSWPVYVGFGTSRRREVAGKGCRRVNMVQKLCTHVCKCKNDTC